MGWNITFCRLLGSPSVNPSWKQPWCQTKIVTHIVMIYSYDIDSYEWRFVRKRALSDFAISYN